MSLDVLSLVTSSVISIAGFSIPATYASRYVASMSVELAKYVREGRARGKRLADLDWSMRHSAIEFVKQAHDYGGPGRGFVACLQANGAGQPQVQKLLGLLESSQIIAGRIESSTLGKLSLDKVAKKMAHFSSASDVIRRLDSALIIYSLSFFLSLMNGKDSCESGDTTAALKYTEAAAKNLSKIDGILANRRAFVLNPGIPYSVFLSSLDETLRKDLDLIASLEQILSSTDELRKPSIGQNYQEFLPFILGKGRYWSRLANMVKAFADKLASQVDVLEFEKFVEQFKQQHPSVEASEKEVSRVIERLEMGDYPNLKILPEIGRVVACKNLEADAARIEEQVRKSGSMSSEEIEKHLGWSKLKVAYLLSMLLELNRLERKILGGDVRYTLHA